MDTRKVVKRGFVSTDIKEFSGIQLEHLQEAAKDTQYLLERGYAVKNATTFIGNHYMFSERQRLALSGSVLLQCSDGTIRDLAGLRGTYRIIDKTEQAVRLIFDRLRDLGIREAVFYLDAPVSNSGRLKSLILQIAEAYTFAVSVQIINDVDRVLEKLPGVISGDAFILNKCESWINLVSAIVAELPETWVVKLMDCPQISK